MLWLEGSRRTLDFVVQCFERCGGLSFFFSGGRLVGSNTDGETENVDGLAA
jgi:hypothetical protein